MRVYGQYLPGLLSPSYCPWLARLTVCLFFNLLLSGDPWIWIRFEMETFVYFITPGGQYEQHNRHPNTHSKVMASTQTDGPPYTLILVTLLLSAE